jgi:integrase
MPVIEMSEHFVRTGLVCPSQKKRIEYCDVIVPGLMLEVRASRTGFGTWYLRYKNTVGKTAYQHLGTSIDLPLNQARAKASMLKAQIAAGAVPAAKTKATPKLMTMSVFMEEHYLPYVKPRKRSWLRDEQLYRIRIKGVFGRVLLSEITRKQVQGFHTDLLSQGLSPASCDHHIKLMKHALNLAVEWEMLEKNPVKGVPLYNVDNKVEHYLNDEELGKLLEVLQTDPNRNVCQIATFLLATGCRLNEALQATWDQVDLETRVWKIPALNSKSKRIRSVPLNDTALKVLQYFDQGIDSGFVFINPRTGERYTTITKVWFRIRDKAGLPNLRLHDLRHQYASFLVNSGRTLYEVQQILGHSDPSVTVRYAHLSLESLRDAAASAANMIEGARRQLVG